jgi:hypothetical protein
MKELNEKELRALIFHSINHHFYDGCDCDDGGGIVLVRFGSSFNIAFTEDHGECFTYTIEATPEAVATFLDELAELRTRLTKLHMVKEGRIYKVTMP